MDYRQIRYEQDGPVTVITIDRPERMNAVGPLTAAELVDAWTRFRDDDAALVGVLTGAGDDAFCAGGDLKAAFEGEDVVPVAGGARRARARRAPGHPRPDALDRPDQADDRGRQRRGLRGGLEWACWTDLCVADEHATFGVTCRRWNIGLGDGGTQRLPRIVGFRTAMELIITGRVIDAREAQRIGLVNEVVPRGTCRERARELAHAIAALPQPALRTDKEAAVGGFGLPLAEGLRLEAACFDRLLDGPEMAEGLRRFNERDHPDRVPAPRRRRRAWTARGTAAAD